MTKANRTKPYSNKGAVAQYLQMKEFRSQATFRICCDGSTYWLVNNHRLTEDEFNSMFPLELVRDNEKGSRIGSAQQIY